MTKKDIILSGMRPTGKLHLGNYLGALKNFVDLQSKYNCFFFIADLHSLNEKFTPAEKYGQVMELAAEFIAAGLDPKKCTLFVQSRLPAHSEMALIFSNVVPVSYLFRMTQFKDKSQTQGEKSVNSALLFYPVLMAADILLYHPAFIPVGDDQAQHVELARDIAGFFNRQFGPTFREPKALHTEHPRVMSIVDPLKKMSKSLGEAHCIYLDDTQEIIKQKLSRAPTDSGDGLSPGAQNLLGLAKIFCTAEAYRSFTAARDQAKLSYADLKARLAKDIADYFSEFRARKAKLLAQPKKLESLLRAGSKKAAVIAARSLTAAQLACGVRAK